MNILKQVSCERWAMVALVSAMGCKSVEVKQDTPQATVATLIKIYEANKPELLDQVFDSTLLRADAREDACLVETFGGDSSCICGQKGAAAAKHTKSFADSKYHAGLKAIHVTSVECRIREVGEMPVDDWRNKMIPGLGNYCGELTQQDALSYVSFTCGSDDLQVILQKRANKWMIVAIPHRTEELLAAKLALVQGSEYAKRRSEQLNKDLK